MGLESLSFKVNVAEERLGLKNRHAIRYEGQAEDGLTATQRVILDKVVTLSNRKSGDGLCKMTFSQAQEEFDVARSTVGLAVKRLGDLKLIESERSADGAIYRYVGPNETELYFYIPQYLFTIDVFTKKAPDVARRLTVAQVTLLAFLMAKIKLGRGRYRASSSSMAEKLGYSESTIRKAIAFLISCDLIYRPEKWNKKGQKSKTYTINKDLYIYEQYEKKAAKKALEQAKTDKQYDKPYVPKQVQELNEEQARKAFYERRKADNERAAAKYQKFIEENAPQVWEMRQTVQDTGMYLSFAEFRNQPTADLSKKLVESERALEALYARFKINPAKFEASYYIKCKICNDTGFRWYGGECDCHKRRT